MAASDEQTRTLAAGASATTAPPVTLSRGATVGRFVVLDWVGAGGMGTVYSAWDPQLSRRVALKVLRPDSDTTERARSLREARALAQSSHPNVVRIFELGEINGAPFIAMELIEGSSLKDLLKTAALTEARIFDLYEAAGRGLAAVHALGIVHRDFKAGNIFVGHDGRACIGDFGLAIASSDSHDSQPGDERTPSSAALEGELTLPGAAPGTPAFMSPEQLKGDPLDARADQFSFAVSLWLSLYGVLPFGREGCLEKPTPATPARRSLAGRLVEPVLRRALSFDRDRRYPSLDALLKALAEARGRPRRWLLTVGGLAAVGALALGVLALRPQKDPCSVQARVSAAVPAEVRAQLRARGGANPLSDVSAHLDAWTAQWTQVALSTCGGDAAVAACLDERLGDVAALAAVLASRNESTETALPAVLALPTPASCATLHEVANTAGDDTTRRALERRLSDSRAALLSGRPRDALNLAHDVVVAARTASNPRLEAQAEYQVGVSAIGVGDLVEGERALRAALAGAMQTRSDRLEAEAWVDLLSLVGDRARRFDEALKLLPLVRGAAARVAEDVDVQAHERFIEAIVLADVGDLQAARPIAEEAVVLAERRVPRDPRAVSRAHGNLGNLLASLGEVPAAVKEMTAARQALEGALPAGHPSFASVANNLGLLLQRTGDLAGARAAFEESARLLEASPGNPTLGVPLDNLGTLAREQGQLDAARTAYLRAREIFSASYGPNHERTIAAELGLALVTQAEGHFDDAAAQLQSVVARLQVQNPRSRPTLEAELSLATLRFEAGAPLEVQTAETRALRERIADGDDLRGVLAELELLEAAQAIRRGDRDVARARLESAKGHLRFVRWQGAANVVTAWEAVLEGQPVDCAKLPQHLALVRSLPCR